MNSKKSIIILIGLCFFQLSHAVEKGIITKDKAGFVTSMRFPGNDKGETTVTPKKFFMEVLNVDPSENFVKRLGTRRDIECYDQLYKGVPVIGGGYVFHKKNGIVEFIDGKYHSLNGFDASPFWRICHPPTYSIGICNPVKMKISYKP